MFFSVLPGGRGAWSLNVELIYLLHACLTARNRATEMQDTAAASQNKHATAGARSIRTYPALGRNGSLVSQAGACPGSAQRSKAGPHACAAGWCGLPPHGWTTFTASDAWLPNRERQSTSNTVQRARQSKATRRRQAGATATSATPRSAATIFRAIGWYRPALASNVSSATCLPIWRQRRVAGACRAAF